MEEISKVILNNLHKLHLEAGNILQELPSQALDWKPAVDMNSLSVLISHIVGAERYWIGDVIMQEPSNRNRDEEFRIHGIELVLLKNRISNLESYEVAAFKKINKDELNAERISPRDGKRYSVAWALCHALEHTAIHIGHMQILAQQWMQKSDNAM